jgi:hypothetical protein
MACSSDYHQVLRLSGTSLCIEHAKVKGNDYLGKDREKDRYNTDGYDVSIAAKM